MKLPNIKLKVRKSGDSYIATIPAYIVSEYNLKKKDTLEVELINIIRLNKTEQRQDDQDTNRTAE